ncbi:hypothetical protein GGI15_003834 [Coemansia interrupta]|uniref:Uncharacterized protein n=1 Tax=Coemansia interrupta TaxID=1126814 RepID=A0A9W8LHU5_9FUNG|nr:hypothetical protein GGI15_003834 [Coemansia interrupta]
MPPGRPKRMRYTFISQARTAQQPVYAWKKVWSAPESDPNNDGAAVVPSLKVYKWQKTGQTIVHEDDEVDTQQQLLLQQQQQQQIAQEQKAQEHEIQSQQDDAQMIDGNPNEQVQGDDGVQTSMDAVDAAVAAVEDIAATIGSCAPANPDLDIESATNVIQNMTKAPDNGIDTIVGDNANENGNANDNVGVDSQDHQQQQEQEQQQGGEKQQQQEEAEIIAMADGSPRETVEPSVVEPELSANLQTTIEQDSVVAADISPNAAVEAEKSEIIVEPIPEAEPGAASTPTPRN